MVVGQISDAGVPDAELPPAPPKLVCGPGEHVQPAPAPEPTWYCAREDGARSGKLVTLFPDGSLAIEGSYKDGKLDAEWIRHYPGGAIAETGTYVDGKRDGTWKQLSPTGAVLGTFDLKAGTGTEKRWYPDGPLYSERALKGEVPHGAAKVYDHDGTVVISAHYWNGKLDGKHEVGTKQTLRIEESFSRGIRDGARTIWQFWLLYVEESYDHSGRPDGDIVVWRKPKVPRFKGQYKHGHRDGLWTWTDRDNNKEKEGGYVDGKRDGAWAEWFENKLVFTGTYVMGRPEGDFITYDHNGNELGRFTMKDGTGTWETFWPNRKPSTKEHMFHGNHDGAYQELTPRGKVVVEGHYAGGTRHGVWKEWTADGTQLLLEQTFKRGRLEGAMRKFVDGKLSVQATYKDGKADGPYSEYRAGKPAVAGQFADDRRTGTWTEYDADGSVVVTATYKDNVLDGPYHQLVNGAVVEGAMSLGRRTGTWTRTDKGGAVHRVTYATP